MATARELIEGTTRRGAIAPRSVFSSLSGFGKLEGDYHGNRAVTTIIEVGCLSYDYPLHPAQ